MQSGTMEQRSQIKIIFCTTVVSMAADHKYRKQRNERIGYQDRVCSDHIDVITTCFAHVIPSELISPDPGLNTKQVYANPDQDDGEHRRGNG